LNQMKLGYSPQADQLKRKILRKYAGINTYFDQLEKQIQESPYDAAEENDIIEGRPVTAYKRSVKTGLFSGNFFSSYLYLSLSYGVNESKQQIAIIGAYVHSYSD